MNKILLLSSALLLATFVRCSGSKSQSDDTSSATPKEAIEIPVFNPDSAYIFVKKQTDLGARVPNTKPHAQCLAYLSGKLRDYADSVVVQEGRGTLYNNKAIDIKNIIGIFNPQAADRVLLVAHWDSRPFADQDPDPSRHKTPIIGANDGASGVGILLEIARNLTTLPDRIGVDIILFDVEDYGSPAFDPTVRNNDGGWCIGSKYWANNPHKSDYKARFGILLDMVGATGAKFYKEQHSLHYARGIVDKVWGRAIASGFDGYFIDRSGGYIIDDHIPINEIRNIPTIDIIQYDPNTESGFNPYWHTAKDNLDIIDRNTLYAVGQTVMNIVFDH